MDLKKHFCEKRQQVRIRLEQLRVLRNKMHEEGNPTIKVDRRIEREESRLAILEDLWDVN